MPAVKKTFPADVLTRVCPKCKIERHKDEYTPGVWNRTARGGFNCKPCKSIQNQNSKFVLRYGITSKEYYRLLKEQDGHCALCPGKPTDTKMLCVDHDHKTGKVRGLLCIRCNTALGTLGDNEEGLLRALTYLRR